MDLGKKVNLIVVPHEQSMPKHLRMPGWLLLIFSILALGVFGTIVFIIVSYTMSAIDMGNIDKVRKDVTTAERKVEIMNTALTQIEDERKNLDMQKQVLFSLHSYENESRNQKEYKTLSKDTWTGEELDALVSRADDLNSNIESIDSMVSGNTSYKDNLPTMLPAAGRLYMDYGNVQYAITGKIQYHYGLDIVAEKGTPIYAAGGGTVTKSEVEEGYGLVVEITHGNGIVTRYCHNLRNVATTGDKVRRGDLVAYMGFTGNTTGTHLHYEVKVRGRYVDPKRFLLDELRDMDGNKVN